MQSLSIQLAKEKEKTYVSGRGPKTIKSQRTQWVEEDMTMDPPNTTNNYTEKEVGQDYYIDVYMFIPFIFLIHI